MNFLKSTLTVAAFLCTATLFAQPPSFDEDVSDENTAALPGIAIAAAAGIALCYKAKKKS